MNFHYRSSLPADFAPSSRIWIYQGSRPFSPEEALQVEALLHAFAGQWKSHGEPVKGFATLLFGQFIILMADESATGVSGCSTDSSVHVIKQIEQQFKNVHLFDRQLLAFLVKEKLQLIPLSQLDAAIENNTIQADSLYFNNTIQTREELDNKWMIPLKDSWLAPRLSSGKESIS